AQDGQVPVRLHRVADHVIQARKSLVQLPVRPLQSTVAVDVDRRPRALRYLGERHVLARGRPARVGELLQGFPSSLPASRPLKKCYIACSCKRGRGNIPRAGTRRDNTMKGRRNLGRTSLPPLLLNPALEKGGAYPLLRLEERRREVRERGVELFDFGTGDPRE